MPLALDALVVEAPNLDARDLWQEMERGMPEAFQPFLDILAARAPRGETGELSSQGFGIRMRRRDQGVIQGVDVQVGAAQPTAHLVAEGHEIIPRGAGTAAIAAAPRGTKREKRAALRADVQARRAEGAIGFVPGNPWIAQAWAEQRAAIVGRLETALATTFG